MTSSPSTCTALRRQPFSSCSYASCSAFASGLCSPSTVSDLVLASAAAGLERRIWALLLRKADALIGCSTALANSATAFEPAIRRRFTMIHNGLDIDYLMRARNSSARIDPRLAGRTFILSVATYEPKKGLDTLLRAFRTIRDDRCATTFCCAWWAASTARVPSSGSSPER